MWCASHCYTDNNVLRPECDPSSGPAQMCRCPVDCEVGQWAAWTECSAACGPGTQTRSRAVLTPAADGGASCPRTWKQRGCRAGPCGMGLLRHVALQLPGLPSSQGSGIVQTVPVRGDMGAGRARHRPMDGVNAGNSAYLPLPGPL